MSFDSFEAFINMGGHGLFVWSAYAITLVVLTVNVLQPLILKQKIISQQKRDIERAQNSLSPTDADSRVQEGEI